MRAAVRGADAQRIERLVDPQLSELPPFLVKAGGLHSGFMAAQISAAALASEAKLLASPASVDSIPTSGSKEDFVSMGWLAAVKAARIVWHLEHLLGLEFLCAAQGLDFLRPLRPGRGAARAHEVIRAVVPHLDGDRVLRGDLDRVLPPLRDGSLLDAVEAVAGPLA
jgi:histidine ammonia-lyase